MHANLLKKVLCGLWFFILVAGLNSVMTFINSGMLFLVFFCFLLIDFVLPNKLGLVAKIVFSLFLVHRIYYVGSFFSPRWLAWLSQDVGKDLWVLSEQGLAVVQPVTAMVLTLAAVILIQTLFSLLFIKGKAITLFLCIGTAFLTAVHLWQGEGSPWYTIFFVILGLIVKATIPLEMKGSFPMGRWLRILLVWVLVMTSIAGALPDLNLDFGDWLGETAWIYDPFGPPGGRTGYGAYDGVLGGPLEEDHTPALRLISPEPLYLKGETRWEYTGRGWATLSFNQENNPQMLPKHLEGKEIEITVEVLSQAELLFTPRYPASIELDGGQFQIYLPSGSDTTYPYEDYKYSADLKSGDRYHIKAFLPADDPDFLRQLSNTGADPRYLSLENVSDRVQQLAQSLVEEEQNGYDKAVALASFLRYSFKWSYSLDTKAPPAGEDFVEYFLFEQSTGYCAHFSTAFVILARSVGLPARWVKGYSYGDLQEDGSYLICNNHAHAWAEVWFDDYGWIPFEPTPGGAHLRPETGVSNPDEEGPSNPIDKEKPDPGSSDEPDKPTPASGKKGNWWVYAAGGAGLASLVAVALLLRRRSTKAGIRKLYALLQARLRIFGWQRRQWETPREHLHRVDSLPDRPRLAGFVSQFEDSVYGGAEEPSVQERGLGKRYSLLGLLFHRLTNTKGHS